MNDNVCSITFGGIGGQGVLKASEICGWAALYAGYHIKKSEVHGMAQRGGSVESHLRFGKKVYSPLISTGGADFLVCFHHEEHPRIKSFLKQGGVDLTVFLDRIKDAIDNPRCLNTCLVGVLSTQLSISDDCWMRAIETVFKKSVVAENKKVFRAGRDIGLL
jgi:indolepyruvate ferredoxin oxidoreductase, beta subunit